MWGTLLRIKNNVHYLKSVGARSTGSLSTQRVCKGMRCVACRPSAFDLSALSWRFQPAAGAQTHDVRKLTREGLALDEGVLNPALSQKF